MKQLILKSPSVLWPLAILLPFLIQIVIGLPIGIGKTILQISPRSISVLIYYGVVVSPSYALLWAASDTEVMRAKRFLIFTALLVGIIPLVMLMSIYVGCFFFNSCP